MLAKTVAYNSQNYASTLGSGLYHRAIEIYNYVIFINLQSITEIRGGRISE